MTDYPSLHNILPEPFEWCYVPAGEVTLESGGYVPRGGQTFDVPEFYIAKYPVTNVQFAKFIDAKGYLNRKWWTALGWQMREEYNWTEPAYWQFTQVNGTDYPIVGVSWYEAVAFCNWLNSIVSETDIVAVAELSTIKITLPTEQQWRLAAQGNDRRIYPWGNNFDKAKSNVWGIDTTPVTKYPQGASPYGVVDMVGNIWQWCLTDYESGLNDIDTDRRGVHRMLYGGAWNTQADYLRTDSRLHNHSHFRYVAFGLRLLCCFSSLDS